MSARTEVLAALQRAGYDQQGAESLLGRAEAATLREAQHEVVAWLVKKAREYRSTGSQQHRLQADAIETLASKVDRGGVRAFLGTGHYRDAMDEHRAEVLRKAADAINALPQDYECDPGRGDAADLLRRMADVAGKDTPRGESTRAASVAEGGDAND